jgi:ABC-type arginine/histidine transport system permease subunit
MLAWIVSHKLFLILLILLDGLVLNHLDQKHGQHGNGKVVDLSYFWKIMKTGHWDGVLAIVLTFAAFCSALLLGALLLLR